MHDDYYFASSGLLDNKVSGLGRYCGVTSMSGST